MALYNDAVLSSDFELQQYENALLDVASTEKIDLTTKAMLAQSEIAADLALFLARNSFCDSRLLVKRVEDIGEVVVTAPLKRWHAYKTLAMVYQDAYNNQLNDRYQGKWTQYNQLATAAAQTLFECGLGIVYQPVPKASQPSISIVPMAVTGATYYIRVSWINAAMQEGVASDAIEATSKDGSAIQVGVSRVPTGVASWNVYAGDSPDGVTLQNSSPTAIDSTWIMPATGLLTGRAPGDGQVPEAWIVDRRILPRG